MKRWEILNKLIDKFNYKSYLEIGVQFPKSNFDRVNIDEKFSIEPFPKHGITPDFIGTSDEFFQEYIKEDKKYDLIFIDGLHEWEQVLRDVNNSLRHLTKNGSILCHDCLPRTKRMQERRDHGGEWTGDVWKAMFMLMNDRDDLNIKVINTDYGCGLIRRGVQETKSVDVSNLDYEYFVNNKNQVLNIISPNEFNQWINNG